MRRIVLPQAARVIIPPLGNEFNNMLKTTSLLAFIGVTELFQDAEIRYSPTFKPVEYFLGVAFWYLVLTTIWSFIQAWIERKLGGQRARRRAVLPRAAADRGRSAPADGVAEGGDRAMTDGTSCVRRRRAKRFGRLEVLKGVSLDVQPAGDRLHHRPLGLRQDDLHPLHQPPREDRRRAGSR